MRLEVWLEPITASSLFLNGCISCSTRGNGGEVHPHRMGMRRKRRRIISYDCAFRKFGHFGHLSHFLLHFLALNKLQARGQAALMAKTSKLVTREATTSSKEVATILTKATLPSTTKARKASKAKGREVIIKRKARGRRPTTASGQE